MEEIRIVTDSVADLPAGIVKELDIVVVPANVIFGQDSYRDGIDLKGEEFYRKMRESSIHPTTSAPAPGEFIKVYEKLAEGGATAIISVHATKKLSAIYSSAIIAKETVEKETGCKIEVVDSTSAAMAQGFLVMMAARLASAKKDFGEIIGILNENIPRIHFLAIIDSLDYLQKGGRAENVLKKAGSLSSRFLKLCLTFKEGKIHLAGFVRPHKRQEKIVSFLKNFPKAQELALEYSPDGEGLTEIMINRIEKMVKFHFPGVPLYRSIATPALGVQAGTGILAATVIEGVM